jgi:copper chaperone CopZ
MTINKYSVSGMTCGGCVNRVKTTLTQFADHVEVTLDPPQATLTNPKADLQALNQALSGVGHYVLTEMKETTTQAHSSEEQKNWFATYRPLLLVFSYILLVCIIVEWTYGSFEMHRFMPNFMAGFFLAFSFFKLLDLSGFASSYAMYDLLAKRLPSYGYVYPFIELGLGIAYLLNGHSFSVNLFTFSIMAFSSLGVIIAVANQQKIRCACLGAVFNLPMSTVTIIEDLLMAGMALYMIT